jgi:membrane associated rhomboid family serine protease
VIPLGTEHARRRPTLVTYVIMAACVVIFLIQEIVDGSGNAQNGVPADVDYWLWAPASGLFRPWQLLTYQFLHGSWIHLIGNMLFLWVFGPPVEDRLRRWGFLAFYLVAGVAAGGLHLATSPNPVIGASGSISGITGAFLVLFPLIGVRFLLFFIIIGVYTIPAWWFILFAIARDLVFVNWSDGVARMAHIGGYIYGGGISLVLLWLKVLPRETYDLFSLGKQAYRRRQFKELSEKQSAWVHEPGPGVIASKRRRDPSVSEPSGTKRAVLDARQKVTDAISAGDLDGACDAYTKLLDIDGDSAMPAEQQLSIANHAMQGERHQLAAAAYELFLKRYAAHHRSTEVRLMLALVNARYLNDPTRAHEVLRQLPGTLSDRDEAVRDSLLEELG